MPQHGPLQSETKAKSKLWIWNIWEVLREKQEGNEVEEKFLEKLQLKFDNRARRETISQSV
jgi:hypothetical protein